MERIRCLGHHLIFDVTNATEQNNQSVIDMCTDLVRLSGCTELNRMVHVFEPIGITVLVLLAESHLSCHTWPEYNAMCIDIFTCSSQIPEVEDLSLQIAKWTGGLVKTKVIER